MRLLPPALQQSGAITLRPRGVEEPINIGRRTETGMQLVRWRHISLVFQGAMNSLDPVQKVGKQIAEAIRLHERAADSSDVAARIDELLETVGLTGGVADRYPHQLSGGQRQRVMIALALACRPSLVIADEPTTALDVVMQAQVLQLLERLREELGLALILISHDLGVLAETCDRIAVMYAGRIVETGAVGAVFGDAAAPLHEAPARLAAGDRRRARASPPPIPGSPPDPGESARRAAASTRAAPTGPSAATSIRRCARFGPGTAAACHYAPWERWPEVPPPVVAGGEAAT